MSLRPACSLDQKDARPPGSLFGAAIGSPVGGFWGTLAVSPPRTPPTAASKYEPLPPEFHLDAKPMATLTDTKLDSVFPSWMHGFGKDVALATFTHSVDVVTLRASPRLECTNVVHPTMVCADAVEWRPLASDASGLAGHLFTLLHQGRATCRIEATVSDDRVSKLVVVQPEYSPITVAAKMAPSSSLLVFDNVRGHIDNLRKLRQTLLASDDTGYVPTQELVATGVLDALVLRTDHSREAVAARKHWKDVKLQLSELSRATADCVDAYTNSELRRVGQRVVDVEAWRRVI
jgi:hypothetical protein